MTAISIPERSLCAVRTLAVDPSDHLLEIGCGRGVAVSLVCEKLTDGKITAIDRSAAMVKIAERRNRRHVGSGRAVLRAVPLDEWDPGPERFNKIFAINVSLFWLSPAAKELDLVTRALTPDGALYLFYQQPGEARTGEIAAKLAAVLGDHGFTVTTSMTATRRSAPMLCVLARMG